MDIWTRAPAHKNKDGDDASVNYASTDDGLSQDEASDFGDQPNKSPPAFDGSDSPNLIDFNEGGGDENTKHDRGDFTLRLDSICQALDQAHQSPTPKAMPDKKDLYLSSYPQAQKSLDPKTPPFTASKKSSPQGSAASFTPARSAYYDALPSIDFRDDKIAALEARYKMLADSHENLRIENDRLDAVNERLKRDKEQADNRIGNLKAKIDGEKSLRVGAEKLAIDLDEKNNRLETELATRQAEYENVEPMLAKYKRKLSGLQDSIQPREDDLQDIGHRLLNAVQYVREIEAFAQTYLASHPEAIEEFAAVDLFPSGTGRKFDSSRKAEAAPLMSFNEPLQSISASSGGQEDSPCSVSPATSLPNNLIEEDISVNTNCQEEIRTPPASVSKALDPQTPKPEMRRPEARASEGRSEANLSNRPPSDMSGLQWHSDSSNIWTSDFEKSRAMQIHQGARPAALAPDINSRRVIMSNLPSGIHIQQVLEHVRGGSILKAHVVSMGYGQDAMAEIEFVDAEKAMAFHQFTKRREFGFFVDDRCKKARILLPSTDSFPVNESTNVRLGEGCTRCLVVTGFPAPRLSAVLDLAGLSRSFTDVVTHFAHYDDGGFEISFSSIRVAVQVRDIIIRSRHFVGDKHGNGVVFGSDPCDAPVEDLQVPFLPAEYASDLAILDPKNASLFLTEEERQADVQRLTEDIIAAADPEDPDAFHPEDLKKNIVWEKRTCWDDIPTYTTYDPDQRRDVLCQRDPASGAMRYQYHGNWVMVPAESRRMWLHNNQDSPNPYTQKTADLFYAASGEIDQRKIVVDDGGIDGGAEQSINEQHSIPAESSVDEFVSAVPSLVDVSRGSFNFQNTAQHVPVGVYANNIGGNSGIFLPSLQSQNVQSYTTTTVFNTPHMPSYRTCGKVFESPIPAPPIMDMDKGIGGDVHGISKAGFQQLTAQIRQDKNMGASRIQSAMDRSVGMMQPRSVKSPSQAPFW
ncbi:hypothetical protein CTRI78_v008803 [Colletotrichum trifolii]|uniref:Uncharacterized protein n=1 Tax=Colletotrichum trifolii TaxID=5466 RepID=A0A4R8QTW9_COLTR|nr:hypothetical protein CTRI78_v008803 [Colletotrichum trifolii]